MVEIIDRLARNIRRERIARARRMSFKEKFFAGGDLFDSACEITKGGIQHDFPHYTPEQVMEELRNRLRRRESRELQHLRRA